MNKKLLTIILFVVGVFMCLLGLLGIQMTEFLASVEASFGGTGVWAFTVGPLSWLLSNLQYPILIIGIVLILVGIYFYKKK
jgi:hypothetical protein